MLNPILNKYLTLIILKLSFIVLIIIHFPKRYLKFKWTILFNYLLVILLVRKGFPLWGYRDDQTYHTCYWTDETDSSSLITLIHSPEDENTSMLSRSDRGCNQEENEQHEP